MNFNRPSDFHYVTGANVDAQHPNGDLDRIIINNDIMPVRATHEKKLLRGMDIAFLMEAVEERARAIGMQPTSFTFSRKITLEQINYIISRWNEIVDWYETDNPFYRLYFLNRDIDDIPVYSDVGPASFWNEILFVPQKMNALVAFPILQQTIEDLFENVRQISRVGMNHREITRTNSAVTNYVHRLADESYRQQCITECTNGLTAHSQNQVLYYAGNSAFWTGYAQYTLGSYWKFTMSANFPLLTTLNCSKVFVSFAQSDSGYLSSVNRHDTFVPIVAEKYGNDILLPSGGVIGGTNYSVSTYGNFPDGSSNLSRFVGFTPESTFPVFNIQGRTRWDV